ncbi:hypothetical protein E2C01_085639 [Portunus trituberculatus]|uniref:Uncharacterized protein n=1 Tax=Portunus trituberculatus TaxID=210409 RepID=A0A5B7J848_PORTR|nr:hypothetical protein [Portunus trituberculatus]
MCVVLRTPREKQGEVRGDREAEAWQQVTANKSDTDSGEEKEELRNQPETLCSLTTTTFKGHRDDKLGS